MDSAKFGDYCNFIRSSLLEWKDVPDSDFTFQLLLGLTNEVYKVQPASLDISPNPIIFRKFNEDQTVVNRGQERRLFRELADANLGPKCYADNEKYRIEEYIYSTTLYGPDYNKKKIRRDIAFALAKFHKTKISWLPRNRYLADDLANRDACKIFEAKCDKDIYTEGQKEIVKKIREIVSEKEKEFIQQTLPKDDLVLSHNDLADGNELLKDGTDEVLLIDYEYCGYNFRGFDIGYMYQESIFLQSDEHPYFKVEEESIPTEQDLRDFISYYLVFSDLSHEDENKIGKTLLSDKEKMAQYIQEKYETQEWEKRIQKLLRETKIGAMTCCHYITTWGIKMYKTMSYNFDHFEYAKQGFHRYLKHKQDLVNKVYTL